MTSYGTEDDEAAGYPDAGELTGWSRSPAASATASHAALLERPAAAATTTVRPRVPARPTHRRLSGQVRALLPLAAVLAVQAALSARLVWSNTAFNDEALYLWSGHWEIAHLLDGTAIPQFQRYFSGAPVIYPVIGAIADSYGGLTLARLLSLLFMLGTTVLVYGATGRLFGRHAAAWAAAVFGLLGPVQFLGSFATYDAMAIFLLALGSCLVICGRGWLSEPLLVVAGLVLALADATKYATALWDPVVIVLAALTATQGGWLRRSFRAARLTAYLGTAVAVALFRFGGSSYVAGILFTTLNRQTGTVSAGGVLRDAAPWIGIVLLLAMRSVVIASSRRMQWLCATLAAAVLLAPLEQARIHTSVSLEKHVAFGAWFGAIAAGYVLAKAIETSKYAKWRIGAGTAAVVMVTGFLQASTFDARWPDAVQATAVMRHVAADASGPVLAEDDEAFRYYLGLAPGRSYPLKGFYYWDVPEARELTGIPALQLAISHHFFHIVEVDFSFPDNRNYENAVYKAVRATAGYRLVARIPWRDGQSHNFFNIWIYQPPQSGGAR